MPAEGPVSSIFKSLLGNGSAAGLLRQYMAGRQVPVPVEALRDIHNHVLGQSVEVDGVKVLGVEKFEGNGNAGDNKKSAIVMASLHGNEPSGLLTRDMIAQLQKEGRLSADVFFVLGSPHASQQYWKAMWETPGMPTSFYDFFRAGLGLGRKLWPDPNRVPENFRDLDPEDFPEGFPPHIKRMQELGLLIDDVEDLSLFFDIHSARGNLEAVTVCTNLRLLEGGGISNFLPGLEEGISQHATTSSLPMSMRDMLARRQGQNLEEKGKENVPMIPQVVAKLALLDGPKVEADVVGIETGGHHDPEGAMRAVRSVTMALHNKGLASVWESQNKGLSSVLDFKKVPSSPNIFFSHRVGFKLNYADMMIEGVEGKDYTKDQFYTAEKYDSAKIIEDSAKLIVKNAEGNLQIVIKSEYDKNPDIGEPVYCVKQFEELERVRQGQLTAVGVPSGATLYSPRDMTVLFVSKSKEEYKDPAVGPYPVGYEDLHKVKFAYPCETREVEVDFDNEHQVHAWGAFEKIGGMPDYVNTTAPKEKKQGEMWLDVQSPYTEKVIAAIRCTNVEDVPKHIEHARNAQKEWGKVRYEDRVTFLEDFAHLLKAKEQHIAQMIHSESGKPMNEALAEARNIVSTIAKTIADDRKIEELNPGLRKQLKSVGVVGLITPFNFPGSIASWTFAPALLAGNSVVWKPSEETPLTAAMIKQLFNEVAKQHKISPNILSIVTGGKEVGEMLVKKNNNNGPTVDKVVATGGHKMGKAVWEQRKDDVSLPILELGGNNAVIITANNTDEQMEYAVDCMMKSFLGSAGQRCTNTRQLIVDASCYNKVLDLVKMRVDQYVKAGKFNPIIHQQAKKQFDSEIQRLKTEGGVIYYPGKEKEKGLEVTPCVVAVKQAPKDEIFAPLLQVRKCEDGKYADMVNGGPLVVAIYSNNETEAWRLANEMYAGHVLINPFNGTGTPAYGMGFGGVGGVKGSGFGRVLGTNPLGNFTLGPVPGKAPIHSGELDNLVRSRVTNNGTSVQVVEFPRPVSVAA